MTKQMNDLHWAACSGSVDILRSQLLTEGISIDSRNAEWETALYSASAAGKRDAVRVLIEAGAKVNARAKKRFSPLHVAVLFGHADLLPLLVNAGANLEAKTIRNMTPLGLAARFGHHSCVQFLLAQGVDVLGNDGDMFGRTPLHWAVKSGQEDIVSVLIKAGADVNVPDNFGKTSVMQAVKSKRPMILSQLIRVNGADITRANRQFHEPIHVAAEKGSIRCLKILLECRLCPDRITTIEQKTTALMIAASNGQQVAVSFLLDHGSDANLQDMQGLTAFDYITTSRMFRDNHAGPQWRRTAVALVREGNLDPCLTSNWPCSWNDAPALRNALELAFRAGFDDLVRVAAAAGASIGNVSQLFKTRTVELPEYAIKMTSTLDWLRRYFRSPRPLKELARKVVRRCVGTPCFVQRLSALELAPGIIRFLMFPELDICFSEPYVLDEEADNEEQGDGDSSDTEAEMEPSVFDSDLYGDHEPFNSDD